MGMRLLLGDSHIRSYVEVEVISHSIFLGPGKELNFVSPCSMLSYLFRVFFLKWSLRCDWSNTTVSFVVGEPDVRFACFRDWWVEGKKIQNRKEDIEMCLRKSVKRIERFIKLVDQFLGLKCDLIIGCGTPNGQMVPYALLFNEYLKDVCEKRALYFFDPQRSTESHGSLDAYRTSSVMDQSQIDNTHLSNKIGHDLSRVASDMWPGAQKSSFNQTSYPFVKVKYFEQFQSYRVIYNRIWTIFFKLLKSPKGMSR